MKNKNRKILWILPLLALPVFTILFWLGGDKLSKGYSIKQPGQELNLTLPQVHPDKDTPRNKMGYYQQAEKNAAQLQKQAKNDPYYQQVPDQNGPNEITLPGQTQEQFLLNDQDANEQKVYQKLEELEKVLQAPDTLPSPLVAQGLKTREISTTPVAGDIDRLEQMMMQMTSPKTEDPELKQLHQMLETILDIQHPQRVAEKLEQASRANKGQVFPVSQLPEENLVSLLDHNTNSLGHENSGFYGLESFDFQDTAQNAIAAVIHETQTLVAGATVKLRLTQDIYIQGTRIPTGHFVYGTANISGERLNITIEGIRYRNSLFPVELIAYGIDGIQGLHINGTMTGKVAKESAGQTAQGLGLTSFDTSLEAQMASAGIEATRNLFTKKAKLIKVTVKAGDPVLLQDKKQKN